MNSKYCYYKCEHGPGVWLHTNGKELIVHTSIVVNCHLYMGTNTLLSLSDYQYEEDYFWSVFLSLPSLSNSQYEQFSHSAPNINLHEKTQIVNLTTTTHFSHLTAIFSGKDTTLSTIKNKNPFLTMSRRKTQISKG